MWVSDQRSRTNFNVGSRPKMQTYLLIATVGVSPKKLINPLSPSWWNKWLGYTFNETVLYSLSWILVTWMFNAWLFQLNHDDQFWDGWGNWNILCLSKIQSSMVIGTVICKSALQTIWLLSFNKAYFLTELRRVLYTTMTENLKIFQSF